MKRGKTMLWNTILLTATAFLMRTVGMMFQVYLSKKIGASGIGLFQLIMSVSMLSTTFALSGIRFATTRLVSEELGRGSSEGARAAEKKCLLYASFFGTAAMLILWYGARTIGSEWIGDARTVLSLRILSLSLPAFSLSAVLTGYFTAVSRVIKSSAVSVIEQLVRISVIVAALSLGRNLPLERACAVIVTGGCVGEIVSFILLFSLYRRDVRKITSGGKAQDGITKRMFSIAAPLALTAYARTALSTVQNLLVPRGLRKYGSSPEKALADYGIIHGMVFPVITFPSAFFYSLAELLVPELTDAQVKGNTSAIASLVNKTLRLCFLFSLGVTAVLFKFSNGLGLAIYQNPEVGGYIKILSLLMPIMYLDTVTDGILRGLGEQLHVMKINIIDSVVSVILVYLLLPKYAVAGYLFMIIFTEVFNFGFGIWRLHRLVKLKVSLPRIFVPVFCAFGSVASGTALLRLVQLPLNGSASSVTLHIIVSLILYTALLCALKCVDGDDAKWLKGMLGITKKSDQGALNTKRNRV